MIPSAARISFQAYTRTRYEDQSGSSTARTISALARRDA
jgi:hypothetical protein